MRCRNPTPDLRLKEIKFSHTYMVTAGSLPTAKIYKLSSLICEDNENVMHTYDSVLEKQQTQLSVMAQASNSSTQG